MRTSDCNAKAILKAAALVALILLFGAGASFAQQAINLTAAPTTTTLPDGTTVPMWGYFCGAAVTGSTATCAALNPASVATTPATWSPVVITVPTGQALTINLTNLLTFTPAATTTPAPPTNSIPTSMTIVGQVGGGLGSSATYVASPDHSQHARSIAASAGAARAVIQHGSGRGNDHLADVVISPSRHLLARVGHASFDSSPHGADRYGGGHHRSLGRYSRHGLSC